MSLDNFDVDQFADQYGSDGYDSLDLIEVQSSEATHHTDLNLDSSIDDEPRMEMGFGVMR